MTFKNNRHGFTLIELLVVVSIVALLAGIVLVSLTKARAKARDSQRVQDLKQFVVALNLYYDTHGVYPCGDSFNPTYNLHADGSASCPFLEGNNGSGGDPQVTCTPPHQANLQCTGVQHGIFGGSAGQRYYPSYWPKDPINNLSQDRYYLYTAPLDRQSYLLQTVLEETPGMMQNDGGVCTNIYEVGAGLGNPALNGQFFNTSCN